jgi:hypothetical protein
MASGTSENIAVQMRCAVQVPEHIAPRQVPDPDVAVRRPKPTARLAPLARVTLMLPASATRPDAVTIALVDATWPWLIPIETVVPLPQAELDEAICTFHEPSNVAAAAGVAIDNAARNSVARVVVRRLAMTFPLVFDAINLPHRFVEDCDGYHRALSG